MKELRGLDPTARAAVQRVLETNEFPPEWNDRLKTITETIVTEIPYIGFIIGLLISLLWPESQMDIWERVKEQVQEAIDRSILARVLKERQEDINGLHQSMENYVQPLDDHEKGIWLITMLGKCDDLRAHLSAPDTRIHTLPLAVVAAQIHVSLLRERLLFGSKLGLGDKTEVWQKDLTKKITEYRSYFRSTFLEWRAWRSEKIKVRYEHFDGFTPADYALLKDEATGPEEFRYEKYLDPSFTDVLKGRIMADADAAMTPILSPTFYFHRYSPPWTNFPADVDPHLFDLRLGPYSDATMQTDNIKAVQQGTSMWTTDVVDPTRAMTTKALVRQYNSIDAMQFFYGAIEGHFAGSKTGGEPREFAAPSGINGVRLGYSRNSILWGLQFLADEKSSEVYGMSHKGKQPENEVLLDSAYKLCGAEYRTGGGPSNTTGIRTLKLRFRHKDTLAENEVLSVEANKVLDVPGGGSGDGVEIILWGRNGGTNQRWNRIYVGDDLWVLMNVATGKVLNLSEQTGKPIQWPRSDGARNERWRFQRAGDNWRILSDANGKALTATTQGQNSSLSMEPVSERSGQLWQLT